MDTKGEVYQYPVMSMAVDYDHLLELHRQLIDELREENKALAAKCAELEEIRKEWKGLAANDASTLIRFIETIDKTPKTCLVEIQARAVDDFKDELIKSVKAIYRPHIEGVCAVVTERLRQQAGGCDE